MQSGIGQIIARRDKTQESARSVSSEFVSGNYFRTFGLKPQTGRLFTDAVQSRTVVGERRSTPKWLKCYCY